MEWSIQKPESEKEFGSYCLTGAEFQFREMKRSRGGGRAVAVVAQQRERARRQGTAH